MPFAEHVLVVRVDEMMLGENKAPLGRDDTRTERNDASPSRRVLDWDGHLTGDVVTRT